MINPTSNVFLAVTIMVLLAAVVCFVQGSTGSGIVCAVFGVLGLIARISATRK